MKRFWISWIDASQIVPEEEQDCECDHREDEGWEGAALVVSLIVLWGLLTGIVLL